eukprot:Hpha_TRINITY_DN3147_c0_g1::TRINITY_DN3147_c0_g1_i1::g.96535::m.96535
MRVLPALLFPLLVSCLTPMDPDVVGELTNDDIDSMYNPRDFHALKGKGGRSKGGSKGGGKGGKGGKSGKGGKGGKSKGRERNEEGRSHEDDDHRLPMWVGIIILSVCVCCFLFLCAGRCLGWFDDDDDDNSYPFLVTVSGFLTLCGLVGTIYWSKNFANLMTFDGEEGFCEITGVLRKDSCRGHDSKSKTGSSKKAAAGSYTFDYYVVVTAKPPEDFGASKDFSAVTVPEMPMTPSEGFDDSPRDFDAATVTQIPFVPKGAVCPKAVKYFHTQETIWCAPKSKYRVRQTMQCWYEYDCSYVWFEAPGSMWPRVLLWIFVSVLVFCICGCSFVFFLMATGTICDVLEDIPCLPAWLFRRGGVYKHFKDADNSLNADQSDDGTPPTPPDRDGNDRAYNAGASLHGSLSASNHNPLAVSGSWTPPPTHAM